MSVFFVKKNCGLYESATGGWTPANRRFLAGKVYSYKGIGNAFMYEKDKPFEVLAGFPEYGTGDPDHQSYAIVNSVGFIAGVPMKPLRCHLTGSTKEPLDGLFYAAADPIQGTHNTWRCHQEGKVDYDPETTLVSGVWMIESSFGIEQFFEGDLREAYAEMVRMAVADTRRYLPRDIPEDEDFSFNTPHFQTWKVAALLEGLGLHQVRFFGTLDNAFGEDVFFSEKEIEIVYEGWTPSSDGSRLTNWSDLSNPESPHYGRHYITVVKFTVPTGYTNILVWYSDSHQNVLYRPIALCGIGAWNKLMEEFTYEKWEHFLEYEGISI